MKRLVPHYICLALLQVCVLSIGLNAAVTIRIKAGKIKDENGIAFPSAGLVLVVVSPSNDEFSGPDSYAYANDDDFVIDAFDLSSTNTDGLFIETIANLNLEGALGAGDPVTIYWFPTRTKAEYLAGVNPSTGDPYGYYDGAAVLSGAAPWVVPPNGGTITLELLTDDAAFDVYRYQDEAHVQPASAGNASLVVPVEFNGGGSDEPLPPTLFAGDRQLEDNSDWYSSTWLGYYHSSERPWYYHENLGFIYIPAGQTESGLWVWSVLLDDWLWTRKDLWPYAYQMNGEWLYHDSVRGESYFYSFNGDPVGWK